MIRSLIRAGLHLLANAIGLIVAAAVLDQMSIDGAAFIIAVVIFTVIELVAQPLLTKMALKNAEFLQGGTALIATFVALVITAWVSDGLSIEGASTWLLATLIVWLVDLLAGIILPAIFLKKVAVETRK